MTAEELKLAYAQWRHVPVDDVQYSHDLLYQFDAFKAGHAAAQPKPVEWLPVTAPADSVFVWLRGLDGYAFLGYRNWAGDFIDRYGCCHIPLEYAPITPPLQPTTTEDQP